MHTYRLCRGKKQLPKCFCMTKAVRFPTNHNILCNFLEQIELRFRGKQANTTQTFLGVHTTEVYGFYCCLDLTFLENIYFTGSSRGKNKCNIGLELHK